MSAQPDGMRPVSVVINGEARTSPADDRTLLVDFIRHGLRLTGTHVGCEQGVCGACSVRVDGELVRSCLMLAVQAEGKEIETVEGLGTPDALHPIQEAFHDNHGLQCGFCTPGMLMATKTLLAENSSPTEPEIRDFLRGNLCRCTGYAGIVASVKDAAGRLAKETP
jgi:carbon-monoxide dehydrogenase small subunit